MIYLRAGITMVPMARLLNPRQVSIAILPAVNRCDLRQLLVLGIAIVTKMNDMNVCIFNPKENEWQISQGTYFLESQGLYSIVEDPSEVKI